MKRYRYLSNGDVEFKGVIYPAQHIKFKYIKFNFDKWVKHWNKIIEEIKQMKLDYGQIGNIHDNFIHDMLMYNRDDKFKENLQEFGELSNKLKVAFHQAYSNYRDSRTGFWGFVSGFFAHKAIERLNPIEILKGGVNSNK